MFCAAGLLQATGWPSVVSVMANWFGKGKRGLIMGVWNAHTSVGERAWAAWFVLRGCGWVGACSPVFAVFVLLCVPALLRMHVSPRLLPMGSTPPPRAANPSAAGAPPSPAGNIVGSLIAAYMLKYGWGWSFVLPGAFIAGCGEAGGGAVLVLLRCLAGGGGGGGGGVRCVWRDGGGRVCVRESVRRW